MSTGSGSGSNARDSGRCLVPAHRVFSRYRVFPDQATEPRWRGSVGTPRLLRPRRDRDKARITRRALSIPGALPLLGFQLQHVNFRQHCHSPLLVPGGLVSRPQPRVQLSGENSAGIASARWQKSQSARTLSCFARAGAAGWNQGLLDEDFLAAGFLGKDFLGSVFLGGVFFGRGLVAFFLPVFSTDGAGALAANASAAMRMDRA